MTVTIKPMEWTDIEAVVQMERQLFTADPWTAELFWSELAEVGTSREVVCAWLGSDIVGYASLRYVGKDGDVNTIAVAQNSQGQGIGRLLMNWLYETATSHGVDQLFLEVRSDNVPALAMYDKDGFERIDLRKNYYGTDVDAIVMRKKLAA